MLGTLPLLVLGDRVDVRVDRVVESSTSTAGVVGVVVVLLRLDTLLPVPSSVLASLAGAQALATTRHGAVALAGSVGLAVLAAVAAAAYLRRRAGPAADHSEARNSNRFPNGSGA